MIDLVAIEKTNKAKRIAEAILEYLEEWMEDMGFELDEIQSGDFNKLIDEFMKIIEREL